MIEGGSCTRLLLKPPHPLRIRGELLLQHLDGNVAAEPAIPRSIELSHPTGTDNVEDFVGS